MQNYIESLLHKWHLHPWLWNLIIIASAALLGIIISFILSFFIKAQTGEQQRFTIGQSLLKHLSRPVSFLIPLLLFNSFIPLLRMSRAIHARIEKATEIALIIGFAWLLICCVRAGQEIVRSKINIDQANNLRQRQLITQLLYIRRMIVALIVVVTIGAVLLSFDTMRKIGAGLLTSVGIGGIIIGFAAQRSLANLLAGFQIAFTQPIRIDDEVIVEGEFGRVEELTFTYVVVRIWDNRRMIMPINYFIEKPFQNWTRSSSEIIGSVYLYADYDLPVSWVREEFMKIVAVHPNWDKRVANLSVTDLKPNVMEIRAIASAPSSGKAFDLRCHIREQLMQRIKEKYPDSLPKTRVALHRIEEGVKAAALLS